MQEAVHSVVQNSTQLVPDKREVTPAPRKRDVKESLNPMEKADEEYEEQSDFIRRVKQHPTLSHLGNEKKLFSLLTAYDTAPPAKERCFAVRGL